MRRRPRVYLAGPDVFRSWQKVNRDFEVARADLELIYQGHITLTAEIEEVMGEYWRARSWLFDLLPGGGWG